MDVDDDEDWEVVGGIVLVRVVCLDMVKVMAGGWESR